MDTITETPVTGSNEHHAAIEARLAALEDVAHTSRADSIEARLKSLERLTERIAAIELTLSGNRPTSSY